jgi:O-acetylserine/cysteine efflux transporter
MPYYFIILAIIISASWGGNFVATRIALDVFPPYMLLCFRFLGMMIILLPFFPRPPVALKYIIAVSVLLGSVHFTGLFSAIYFGLDVQYAVISTQLGVPFSCILGSIFFKDSLGRTRTIGIIISFIGICVISVSPRLLSQLWQFGLACGAAFAWASANIYMKKLGQINILAVLAWVSVFAVPQLALCSYMFERGQMQAMQTATLEIWGALSYIVIICTIFAFGGWYWLLSKFDVSQVVPYSLLVPIFGFMAVQWFFNEPVNSNFIIGGLLTIAGVAMIVFRRPKSYRNVTSIN